MKFELVLFGATAFVLYNIYHDGKYTKMLWSYKKYYTMASIALVVFCLYLMSRRNPAQARNMLLCTNNMIKYLPINKSSLDLLSPIFDLSGKGQFVDQLNSQWNPAYSYEPELSGFPKPAVGGRSNSTNKRSVSETKKKYVASMQDWKCGKCQDKLNYTFEVDHKLSLEQGGGNDVTNLVALCRECHGQKTALDRMGL